MDSVYEDRFVVFLLEDLNNQASPETIEREIVSCALAMVRLAGFGRRITSLLRSASFDTRE